MLYPPAFRYNGDKTILHISKRIHFKFSFFIIVFYIASPLVSQENTATIPFSDTSDDENFTAEIESITVQTITLIEVMGLRRTRPHIVMLPLEQFKGLDKTAFDQDEVFEVVSSTGVLRPISAELVEKEDNLILQVTVKERWTIFPIPLFMPSSDEFSFSFFLLDTNSFGIRDITALGGTYNSFGWSAMAMYDHTPNYGSLLSWNVFFMYGHQDREVVDRDKILQRKYSMERLRFSLGASYPLTDTISGSFAMSFSDINIKDSKEVLNSPDKGASILSFTPGITFRQSSWDGYFNSQQSISLRYSYNYAVSGSSFYQTEYHGIYQKSLIPGFRIIARSGGVWKSLADDNDTAPLFEERQEKAQVEILPRNFLALHYAGFSAGLEKSLFRFRFGTLSAHCSWQGVFSYGTISEFEFNHGPAGGLNFQMGRSGMLGIGGILAYNINSGLFQFSVNMGLPF